MEPTIQDSIHNLTTACWAITLAISAVFMVGCWITFTLLRGVNEIIRGISSIDQHLAQIAANRKEK